jgi:ubiquinone/menaquinone biosynthesis C-methylase UbiE
MPESKNTPDAFTEKAHTWDDNPARVAVAEAFFEAALPLAGSTAHGEVLDFGCGTGLLGLRFAPLARQVHMLDNSPAMLGVLRQKIAAQGLTNVTPHLGEWEHLGLPAGSMHLIVSLNMLHHVADVPAVLAEMRRLCAPGGQIIVGDLLREDGSFHGPEAAAHNGFDVGELSAQFEAAGLSVLHTAQHHSIRKPDAHGVPREYPQFLLQARPRQ